MVDRLDTKILKATDTRHLIKQQGAGSSPSALYVPEAVKVAAGVAQTMASLKLVRRCFWLEGEF